MMRCSAEAYAACPYSAFCGPRAEAVYVAGSECDDFNDFIAECGTDALTSFPFRHTLVTLQAPGQPGREGDNNGM